MFGSIVFWHEKILHSFWLWTDGWHAKGRNCFLEVFMAKSPRKTSCGFDFKWHEFRYFVYLTQFNAIVLICVLGSPVYTNSYVTIFFLVMLSNWCSKLHLFNNYFFWLSCHVITNLKISFVWIYSHGFIEFWLRRVLHVAWPGVACEHFYGKRRVSRYELETNAWTSDNYITCYTVPVR